MPDVFLVRETTVEYEPLVTIIKAVLGPTNTGKTYFAVDRMLSYPTGMMGFPLRLLAREVYDRVVRVKGVRNVALLTGEEYIVPETARYFLCTAEAMPRMGLAAGKAMDFIAVDEIQMAADTARGHVFTEHLLSSRGTHETLFMGAETMAPLIRKLIPEATFDHRPRFSKLSYIKPMKLGRLPRRSAVIGFSAADVYGLAELMRRQKGGAAIVMGSLSPRTRNAQVDLFQSGEVDYLIATDAIGMGLNMDVNHIAFSELSKFDGRNFRGLTASEAAQIAGRAGRYKRDGTFSTLSGMDTMDPMMVAQIEDHSFETVKRINWRNSKLNFSSVKSLIASLEMHTAIDGLFRQTGALDMQALKALAGDSEITALATSKQAIERLWAVSQVPDFRQISLADHVTLQKKLYMDLMGPRGTIDHDFVHNQVKRLDNTSGDIDTLAQRLASIRVWTYVSHRANWLSDAAHWAHVTRSVEDKLSDALHEKLTQRFVDRRTAVLMRSLRQRDALSVSIDQETNTVSVEGHEIGELQGFSFKVEAGAARDDQKTLKAAAESSLKAEILRRAKLFCNVGAKTLEIDFSKSVAHPRLAWEGNVFASLRDTGALFAPRVKLHEDTLLHSDTAELVREKAQDWLDTRVAEKLGPLIKLAQELNGDIETPEGEAALSGLTRGVAFQILENFGAMSRADLDRDLRQLDQEARKGLRRFGVRIGAIGVYIPHILKPHATELRLFMWAQKNNIEDLPTIPTPGMVWADLPEGMDAANVRQFYALAGFQICGKKAVRMDMVERLADAVRPLGQGGSEFEVTPEIMGLVGLSGEAFSDVMKSIGYSFEKRMVDAAKPETPKPETAKPETATPETATPETLSSDETATANSDPLTSESEVELVTSGTLEATEKTGPEKIVETEETTDPENNVKAEEKAELVERYVFKWAVKRRTQQGSSRKEGSKSSAKASGKQHIQTQSQTQSKGKPAQKARSKPQRPSVSTAPKREKKADPDSPFAALAGLKDSLTKK